MGISGNSKGKKGGKRNKKTKPVVKTRKELRKEKRKQKKTNRAEHYQNKNQSPGKYVLNPNPEKPVQKSTESQSAGGKLDHDREKKKQDIDKKRRIRLEKQMEKNRKIHLKEANIEEDKIIKRLEKDLKLNKRKSKSIPKSFQTDGLNCIL